MKNDNQEIRQHIERAIQGLAATLNNDKEKINILIQSFIVETPILFAQLKSFIDQDNKRSIINMLHKLKGRYGYFGLDHLMTEMGQWKNNLREDDILVENRKHFKYFEKMNKIITNELRSIDLTNLCSLSEGLLPLSGKKILIAEDDEVNAMVFGFFAEELGGEVLKATDGNEAVKIALEMKPDIIFMDVHMPYFSGIEAIKTIRFKNFKMPIISLSASTRLHEKQQSIDAGATDFLTKPAKREIIQDILLKYLS